MNYLKKKIRAHKKAIEDDEDYGDYIPEVPPHPDDLLKNQQNLVSPFAVNNDFFIKSPQAEQQPSAAAAAGSEPGAGQPQPKIIRKPKEEKEEWQWFNSLTARVQQTVAKTEKEIEKIKATTKVDEIEAKTEPEFYFAEQLENLNQQFEEKFSSLETEKKRSKKNEIKSPSVALNLNEKLKSSTSNQQIVSPTTNQSTPTSLKSLQASLSQSNLTRKNVVASTTSQWIGFNRDSVELLDDEDEEEERLLREKEEQERLAKEQEEEERKRIELLKQKFGFVEPSLTVEQAKEEENEDLDDPFDTEYAEKKYESTKDLTSKIEKLEKELSNTQLNLIKPTTLDLTGSPAKQIDRTTSSQCIKDYSRASNKYSSVPCTPGDKIEPDEIDILTTLQTGRLSRYNSKESLALSETLVSRTNSVQSIHSILSNQSRRSSTNPFDIETSALDDDQTGEDVPNVIAALTEEFTKTIGNFDKEEPATSKAEHTKTEPEKASETVLVDEEEKKDSEAAKLIEANKEPEEERINQDEEEFDNDLNKVDDELSQEVVISSEYIVEEAAEDAGEVVSEEEEEEFNQRQAIGDSGELEIDICDSAEHPELQFDELGNLKGSFKQLVAEPEYSEEDIEEVQNFIKEQIPFDPFETIVEDEPTNSNSNRQSVSSPNDLSTNNSLNKQNSTDKDSAFKDNVPSNKDDLNSDLNKSDLNNNDSKAANQPATVASTKISVSSDQSLVIDEQQLTNEYFDPFRTVNDLTPTSEVFGEDQHPGEASESEPPPPPPQPEQQDYLEEEEEEDLPLPPPDLIEPDLEKTVDEMGDNEEDVNLEDLPPPPPELTSAVEEEQQHVASEDLQQQQSDGPKPEAEQEQEQQLDTQAEEPGTVQESDKQQQDKEAEKMEVEESGPAEEAKKEEMSVEPSRLDLDINPDEIITSEELSNLVADPFDTTIYNYDTLKTFIPVASRDQIDEFNEKFKTKEDADKNSSTYLDPFKSPLPQRRLLGNKKDEFDTFDPFQTTRPPKNTPVFKRKQVKKAKSTSDTDEEDEEQGEDSSDFSSSDEEQEKLRFVIRERMKEDIENQENLVIPLIPGPPQTPTKSPKHQLRGVYDKPLLQVGRNRAKLREEYKRIHKKSLEEAKEDEVDLNMYANIRKKYEEDHPEAAEEAPLFVEDTTELEDYENPFENLEWNFYVRYPIKKKITGNRFWKLATVKFLPAINTVQLFNYVPKNKKQEINPEDCAEPPVSEDTTGEPLQELLLQGSYGVSEIASQQYDEFGKIFTIKLQYKFYREKVGADTGKKIAHNMKIIQGKLANFQGKFSKKFNDVVNVNVNNIVDLTNKDNILVSMAMLQHTPQITELFKFGSHNYAHLKQFKAAIEQTLFKMPVARDRALTYRAEEMQVQMQDEYYCELNTAGIVQNHKARVRLFLLSFLNGNPVVEIGINDRTREGKEVVGRNDIMPISTEEWIRVEDVQFHHCVEASAFQADDKLVKLVPPDACTIEVMRFRVRPSKNRELPLIVSARMLLNPRKVELRIEAMAAGAVSKKRDADVIPCEDIVIRVHIPEEWIYFFRLEKHTRFGSVKSASRRPGKLKGIERILGATTNIQLEASLLEASAGQAKYEHAFHSLVWRIPRLPKEGQGAYRPQTMVMKLPLTESFDKIPENIGDDVFVEYRMPSTVISHAVVRSISISQSDSETPPEKYAAYVSKVDYKLKMTIEHEDEMNAYNAMTASAIKKPIQETPIEEKDSDDDIDYDDEEDDVEDE